MALWLNPTWLWWEKIMLEKCSQQKKNDLYREHPPRPKPGSSLVGFLLGAQYYPINALQICTIIFRIIFVNPFYFCVLICKYFDVHPLGVRLNSLFPYFVEGVCTYVHPGYWSSFILYATVWFWLEGNIGLME